MAAAEAPPPMDAEAMARKAEFLADWPDNCDLTASSADYYFNSYHHYGVHEDVLKDLSTTNAYLQALRDNAHLLQGKVVLDVSAGLGLCSMLAAEAGAKLVIALESQPELARMAENVARKNGFPESQLKVVCTTGAENLRDPAVVLPGGADVKVDVIVSQWAGYCLLYEARLQDVLDARDRWLRPGGIMLPDRASMHAALMEERGAVEYFATPVWGYNLSDLRDGVRAEPVVEVVQQKCVLSHPAKVLDLDLRSCTAEEAFDFGANFQLRCRRGGHAQALVCWFVLRFGSCHKPVVLDTSPQAVETCWKQTYFRFAKQLEVRQNDTVHGMIAFRRLHEKRRNLDVKILCRLNQGESHEDFFKWG